MADDSKGSYITNNERLDELVAANSNLRVDPFLTVLSKGFPRLIMTVGLLPNAW